MRKNVKTCKCIEADRDFDSRLIDYWLDDLDKSSDEKLLPISSIDDDPSI